MLATLDEDDVRATVDRIGLETPDTHGVVDVERLLGDLRRSAQRGYAVDDEEDISGVLCVGAAVANGAGACVAGISVTALNRTSGPTPSPTSARSSIAKRAG